MHCDLALGMYVLRRQTGVFDCMIHELHDMDGEQGGGIQCEKAAQQEQHLHCTDEPSGL